MELNEINRAIGNLEGTIKEGFKAVNFRLDKINGSLDNHETRLNRNETKIDEATGSAKMLAIIWGVIITIVNLVIGFWKR